MATIKRQLQLLLPGAKCFLDVDDMVSVDELELYVESSHSTLILLGSPRYFASRGCLREIEAAKANGQALILVHDDDASKSGAPLDELKLACRSKAKPRGHACAPAESYDFLFTGRQVIPWHRITLYQMVSVKRIAEQLLLATPAYQGEERVTLVAPGDGTNAAIHFGQAPIAICVSAANAGADALVCEVKEACGAGDALRIVVWGDGSELRPSRFLLYLNASTFVGPDGEALADDVRAARSFDVPIVLVHENDPSAGGCPFGTFFQTTPADLIDGGLFGPVAIEWHPGPYRSVSIAEVAKALGGRARARSLFGRTHRMAGRERARDGRRVQGSDAASPQGRGLEPRLSRPSARSLLIQPTESLRSDSMPQRSMRRPSAEAQAQPAQGKGACPPALARVTSADSMRSDAAADGAGADAMHGQL